MEIHIDVSKIVADTLKNYPSCEHLQGKFERLLQEYFEDLQSQVELGVRVGGLDEVRADYDRVLKDHKSRFMLKDWTKFNVFNGGTVDEHKAEREVELRFFQAAFDWFEKNLGALMESRKPENMQDSELFALLKYPERLATMTDLELWEVACALERHPPLSVGNNVFVTIGGSPAHRLGPLRLALKEEYARRAKPKARSAPKSKTVKVLPDLNEVLRYPERLPDLWGFLTRQQESGKGVSDFFDESGYIGSNERSAAPLMGVANGLRISAQIKADFTETDVYISLCRCFNVAPSGEPHKAKKTASFKDVRDWVKDFFRET
jgi:hypothetical protein